MTTDTTPAGRANRNGDPCPPWCTTDHGREIFPGFHNDIHASTSAPARGSLTFAIATQVPGRTWGEGPRVLAAVLGAAIALEQDDALSLAEMVDKLSLVSSGDLPLLAADIRAAAALLGQQ